MAIDRRTVGLSAPFALFVVPAVADAAAFAPPVDLGGPGMAVLVASAVLAVAGLAWSWRSVRARERAARQELVDAVDLAAIMVIDPRGRIRHWSRGCQDLYGWSASDAVGRKWAELLGVRLEEAPAELWRRFREAGQLTTERIERHRDGRELVVNNHARLVEHPGGRYSAVIAITDVTEQRRAEDALRLTEARLATAVSVQGIFIYEVDLLDRRTIWTTPGESFFGGVVDGADLDHWQGEHARQIGEVVEQAVAAGEDRLHFDFDFHYPDGALRQGEG